MKIIVLNHEIEINHFENTRLEITIGNISILIVLRIEENRVKVEMLIGKVWVSSKIAKEAFYAKDVNYTDIMIMKMFFSSQVSQLLIDEFYSLPLSVV